MTETPIEVKAERGDSIGPIRFMVTADGYVETSTETTA